MKFEIEKQVFEKFPSLVVAIPIITGFDNQKSKDESVKILRETEALLKSHFDTQKLADDPRIKSYLNCFLLFGIDPSVFLPAHFALAKRVIDGGNIPDVNPMVNLYNSFSIANITPFGGEDLDQVYGDFRLFLAKGGENWYPIGGSKSKPATRGELVWGDEMDLSTRALNWRQCDRTKLVRESTNGYFIMDGFSGVNDELIKKTAEVFVKTATNLFGGKAEILWLDKENPEASIVFESKTVVDRPEPAKQLQKTRDCKYKFLAGEIQKFLVENSPDFNMPIDHPSIEKFGDFAVRGEYNFENLDLVEKVDKISGFNNIWIKKSVLLGEATKILDDTYLKDLSSIGNSKTVVIDYSAPNIAKPFGIGHLRSTNIGQAIYNIYKILGWKCIGDNHLGDWGTQFGKMIAAIKHWGMEESIEGLEKLYVRFHAEAESDKTLEDEARNWFAKLESGDKEARDIWKHCVEISLKEFNRVYELLGVKIDFAYGEAFYEEMLPEVIQIFRDKKLTRVSDGAEIVDIPQMAPAMILKSDGATTYFTRDLATIKFRMESWKPDLMIYEVGSEQALHFKQVFAAANLVGWKSDYVHIGHGLIRWKDGKFSTRKGDTIHLSEVIDMAMSEAKKIAPENSEEAVKKVAIGAIKFNDLCTDPKRDVVFDWDRVMSMDGNSGPYLQYTYARCRSVINKSTNQNTDNIGLDFDENEMPLLRYFYIFLEKIVEAGQRMSPAVLAEYLLNLARKYNEFYAKCRIVGEPEEARRVFLTKVTAKILQTGLGILGIDTLEKM